MNPPGHSFDSKFPHQGENPNVRQNPLASGLSFARSEFIVSNWVTCHGRDGKGLGNIPGLRGKLPRNFTDMAWQEARTDGELFWIMKNGSPGMAMAAFIPMVFTEEEAWQVIQYVRSFGQ